jgi:hypothetical protein
MCGRFARASELEAVLRLLRFDTSELTELHPRYNVALTFTPSTPPARFALCCAGSTRVEPYS